jgi:hypothetical protein
MVPPVVMLLISIIVEWYILLPYRFLTIRRFLPEIQGDIKRLQPALFSICTHLIASDSEARGSVSDAGLGYEGVATTLEGVVMEIMEWNHEHTQKADGRTRKTYTSSVSLAERLQGFGTVAPT